MSSSDPTPPPAPEGDARGRTIKIAAIVVALLVVVSGIAFAVSRMQGGGATAATPAASPVAPSAESAPEPGSTTSEPGTTPPTPADPAPPAPVPAPSAPKGGTGCTTATGVMHDPKRFKVEARGVDSRMITVGKDSDGNPGAPPPSESQTTAYYSGSPEVNASKGNTILTIHTYSPKNGANALGNKLYSDSQGLKVGDIIRITDGEGKQTCYRYSGNKKVWVKSYDPKSGVFHNLTGPPQLAIMICWDHNASTNDWDSRIIFYASLIPAGE